MFLAGWILLYCSPCKLFCRAEGCIVSLSLWAKLYDAARSPLPKEPVHVLKPFSTLPNQYLRSSGRGLTMLGRPFLLCQNVFEVVVRRKLMWIRCGVSQWLTLNVVWGADIFILFKGTLTIFVSRMKRFAATLAELIGNVSRNTVLVPCGAR